MADAARAAPLTTRLRRRVGGVAVDSLFRGAALVGKLHPAARPHRHDVEVTRDVAYLPGGGAAHRLDIYRPRHATGPLPVILYIHGGGFRILSKDTHWVIGLAFARRGYLVLSINYRLAPQHRFPAAAQDAAAAYCWAIEHAAALGGDLDRLVVAGESAGGNLTAAVTLMTCFQREEPWARRVFDTGVVPRAWLPYCPILQVSDVERFARRKPELGTFLRDRLREVSVAYLGGEPERHGATLELADPLRVLEGETAPARPLPPCLVTVGTADPLLDDSRRLNAALSRRGVVCRSEYYPREVHAFHVLVWRPEARRCWQHTFEFLAEHVSPAEVGGETLEEVAQ